jgi:protein arginine N-methyltransferase 1
MEYFEDARKRFLKPGGKLIPSQVELIVGLVETAEMWSQVEFWKHHPAGFDFTKARDWAVNTGYPAKYSPAQLLSQPARLSRVDLYTAAATPFVGEVTLVASRAGSLHGIGGWFSSQLSPSVSLTNSPIDRQPIERRNVFLPIDQCIPLAEGDVVRVRLHIDPREMMLSWNVEVTGKIKRSFTHSTLNGMLLSQEDLEKTLPEFVPRLNPHGEARRSVLELCDGKRSLKEIEQEVFRRHSSLFASGAEAAAFIAEVVTGYSL